MDKREIREDRQDDTMNGNNIEGCLNLNSLS